MYKNNNSLFIHVFNTTGVKNIRHIKDKKYSKAGIRNISIIFIKGLFLQQM